MKKPALSLPAILALLAIWAAPAEAQNHRSWVSSGGSGNACTILSPCADFQTAISVTNAGGEVNCVDQGEFQIITLFITKTVTIDCQGVQARMTSGIEIDAAATDVVVLRGLDISGTGTTTDGIRFRTGAALHVEKCVIHDFNATGSGWGIVLQSLTASSTMELYVSDTAVMNDGVSGTGAGIIVQPQASNTVSKVILNKVEARNNFFGIKADGTFTGISGGVVNMTVRDSVASGNSANGIVATTNGTGPAIVMMINHSTSSHNGAGYGVIADGPKTLIALTHSRVSGNNLGIGASNGGQLVSYQNNDVLLNSTNGSPTSVASAE